MSGQQLDHEAYQIYKRTMILIYNWKRENTGKYPRYLFLSPEAFTLLSKANGWGVTGFDGTSYFMGMEIAPVGVKGIYVGIGEEFTL